MQNLYELKASEAYLILPLLKQVQQLHVDNHPHIFRGDATDSDLETFLQVMLAKDDMTALVATSTEGTPLGYLIFEIHIRDQSALKHARRTAILHQVAVEQSMRRRGIGGLLIKAMKERLDAVQIETVSAQHFVFNTQSSELLKSCGLLPLSTTVEGTV